MQWMGKFGAICYQEIHISWNPENRRVLRVGECCIIIHKTYNKKGKCTKEVKNNWQYTIGASSLLSFLTMLHKTQTSHQALATPSITLSLSLSHTHTHTHTQPQPHTHTEPPPYTHRTPAIHTCAHTVIHTHLQSSHFSAIKCDWYTND